MNADRSTSVKSGVERTKMSNNSKGRNFSFPKKHLALLCLKAKQTLEDCYGADFWDMESGVLKEGFLLLTLNEKEYYFLERPVFCAVDDPKRDLGRR